MPFDVAPRSGNALVLGGPAPHQQRPQQPERRGYQLVVTGAERGEQAGQVGGIPVAGHIRLAESHRPVRAKPPEEIGRVAEHQPGIAGQVSGVGARPGDLQPQLACRVAEN